MTPNDQSVPADPLVHLHLHVPASARRHLRVAAAGHGLTMSDMVARWATSAVRSSGLTVAPLVPEAEVCDGR